MNLKDYLNKKKLILEPVILDFLKTKKGITSELPFLEDAVNRLEDFVTQGKMLRGILFLTSLEMFKKNIDDTSLRIAAALELTHSSLLIHDDIMDNDLKRRGKPTVFAQYISESSELLGRDSQAYGISQGINVGDISLFLAYELLSNCSNSPELNSQLLRFYTEELVKVGAAQMQDVAFGYSLKNPSIEDILNVYVFKSGRYTFSLPLVMGAILSGQNESTIKKLDEFGEKLGTIFQIKDDEIGIFGDEKEIGKPVGSDIRENKKTIFRALLFAKADNAELQFLESVFGNKDVTADEIERVKLLIEQLSVKNEIEKMEKKLISEVYVILRSLQINSQFRQLFTEFIEYNLKRSA